MKNTPLIAHVIVAIKTTTTFLSQMATLIVIAYINTHFVARMALRREDVHTEHDQ